MPQVREFLIGQGCTKQTLQPDPGTFGHQILWFCVVLSDSGGEIAITTFGCCLNLLITIRETKTKLPQHKKLKSCSKVSSLQIGPEQQGCLFACVLCEARREGENIWEFVNIEP